MDEGITNIPCYLGEYMEYTYRMCLILIQTKYVKREGKSNQQTIEQQCQNIKEVDCFVNGNSEWQCSLVFNTLIFESLLNEIIPLRIGISGP